jgi:hypothetical protein
VKGDIIQTMVLSKETKNTVRYDARKDTEPVPNIYVLKTALPTPPPSIIQITISEGTAS